MIVEAAEIAAAARAEAERWAATHPWDGDLEGFVSIIRSYMSCPRHHSRSVPVDSVVTGERLAALCLNCNEQLPDWWLTVEDAVYMPEPRAGVPFDHPDVAT